MPVQAARCCHQGLDLGGGGVRGGVQGMHAGQLLGCLLESGDCSHH